MSAQAAYVSLLVQSALNNWLDRCRHHFVYLSKRNEEGTGVLGELCLVSGIMRLFLPSSMRPTLLFSSRASKISVRGKFYQIF